MATISLSLACTLHPKSSDFSASSKTPYQKRYADPLPVTHRDIGDGLGAQYRRIVFAMCYAEFKGRKFLYHPIASFDHNYSNEPGFVEKLESVFNLKEACEIARPNEKSFKLVDNVAVEFFARRMDRVESSRSLAFIRERFYCNKEKSRYLDPDLFNIAIHIRRPNACDNRSQGSDVPDWIFKKNIDFLRKKYAAHNPKIHIFSQGDIEEFKKEFPGDDVIYHINEDVASTFCSMVFSDVLLTSPSALSYVAALLSHGEIYYQPYPYGHPLPSWHLAPTRLEQNWLWLKRWGRYGQGGATRLIDTQ